MSYDKTLEVGPYNFGFSGTRPDWVEHYAYQNGLLVWLWDTSQKDNNTSVHPGQGLILPIDAHAKPLKWKDGSLLRNKIQPFDAPFKLVPEQGLHAAQRGRSAVHQARPGQPGLRRPQGHLLVRGEPHGQCQGF